MKQPSKVLSKTAAVKKKPVKRANATNGIATNEKEWNLRLYVAGRTAHSIAAINNLQMLCENHLKGQYTIEIIDLLKNPKLAAGDQIVAIPTLVRHLPEPIRKIIGDLSNVERVLVGLDIQPVIH